jgi:hypothetical protein
MEHVQGEPQGHAHLISKLVKEGLQGVEAKVKTAIVEQLVKEEIERRIRATSAVFSKINAAEKELRKIKPKFLGYDSNGKGVGEPIFTKEEAETLRKTKETLEKLNSALSKAFDEGNFDKVFEQAGNQ